MLKYQQKEQLQTNLDSFEVHFYFFLLIVYFLQKSIKDLKKRKKERNQVNHFISFEFFFQINAYYTKEIQNEFLL